MSDWNAKIIDEFRTHDGVVGGTFEGIPVLLLHTKGAKTGTRRVHPLVYQPLDGAYAIFASKGGAPTNPDWYHNLMAHPDTKVEVGASEVPVTARIASADERGLIWEKQKHDLPFFAEYEAKTERTIPVIILELHS